MQEAVFAGTLLMGVVSANPARKILLKVFTWIFFFTLITEEAVVLDCGFFETRRFRVLRLGGCTH